MNIKSIGSVGSINCREKSNQKTIKFTGKLLYLETAKSITPLANDAFVKTFDSEINWLKFISKRIKNSPSNHGKLTNKTRDLFNSVKESFETDDNKKFLDNLFRNSKDDSKIYKKHFNQIVGQFQNAGVPYNYCKDFKSELEFIEEVSSYSQKDNLFLKKFNL